MTAQPQDDGLHVRRDDLSRRACSPGSPYSLSDESADSDVAPSSLMTTGGVSSLALRGRRVFGFGASTTGAATSATGSFTASIAGMATARRPRVAGFLETAVLRAVAGVRAAGFRTVAALRAVAVPRVVAAVLRVLAGAFRAVAVAVLRAAVGVLRAAVAAVFRGVAILRAAAAGLRVAAVLRAVVAAAFRGVLVLRAVIVVFAAARFGAGAALRVVVARAAGLRDATVFVAAPRRPAAFVVFVAAGLRALVAVVFFAAARTAVFTVFAAALTVFTAFAGAFMVLDTGFGVALRAVVVFVAVAARFAGARRVDALTAIARVRGVAPVSPVLSLLTASLLLSR